MCRKGTGPLSYIAVLEGDGLQRTQRTFDEALNVVDVHSMSRAGLLFMARPSPFGQPESKAPLREMAAEPFVRTGYTLPDPGPLSIF
jgi:hypothetical protein